MQLYIDNIPLQGSIWTCIDLAYTIYVSTCNWIINICRYLGKTYPPHTTSLSRGIPICFMGNPCCWHIIISLMFTFFLQKWLFRGCSRIRGYIPTYPYGQYLYHGRYLWYTQLSLDRRASTVEVYASRSDVHALRSGLESQLTTLRSELSTLRCSAWRGGGLSRGFLWYLFNICDIHPGKIKIWSPKPWRFGSDGFPFQVLVIFQVSCFSFWVCVQDSCRISVDS